MSLAVAEAVLTVIEEELQANAKEVGGYLMEKLRTLVDKYDCLGDVRFVQANHTWVLTQLLCYTHQRVRSLHWVGGGER